MQNDSGDDKDDSNVFRFISELRQEALYISSEKNLLQELNEKVRNKTEELLQSTWVTTKKRLFLLPQREFTIQNIHEIVSIGAAQFAEAKNVVGFQNAGKLGALLQILRTQPEQLAQWLIIGEQLNDEQTHLSIMQSIVSGLYASLIFPEDINYMLVLLHELAKYQLFRNEKPQRALKQRANSFECLYYMFHEVLLSAKYFLSGAFEVPILRLLTIDYYLDIDPHKSEMRFHQEENIKLLFNSPEEYRNVVVKKLAAETNVFISGLKENSLSFPKPLAWLAYQISKLISDSFDEKEANAVLVELIFTMFICPAIVNPLQYGICDAQITQVSRHNLMQIGQIIQNLALMKHESPDQRAIDLYSLISKDTVVQLMEDIFSENKHNSAPFLDVTPFIFRDVALFTEQEIRLLVTFLQRVHSEIMQNEVYKTNPILTDSIVGQISALSIESMANSMPKQNRLYNGNGDNNYKRSSTLLSLVSRTNSKLPEEFQTVRNIVLLFSIRTDSIEPVGMLSEGTIIDNANLYEKDIDVSEEMEKSDDINDDSKVSFTYQDEGSIGNTSDNLEAISEGASNHSVASSLEMENEDQNDNYSDMLSANVSGRGTPNISGRDTPSSQVNENDDRGPAENRQADNAQLQQQQSQLSRQIRSEIDDKFCKFEIKLPGPGRDETTSLISETWSTDVLASDNEAADANDSRNEQQCFSLIDQPIVEVPINMLDVSETQSESAWSTDVMASDTERLIDVDNDDTGSIAQSDDTNSIAPSDDTRSETDENLTPGSRRLSSSSNSFMNQSNLASNFQEMRRLESRMEENARMKAQSVEKSSKKDSNANVIFKPLPFSSTQNTLTYSEQTTEVRTTQSSTCSFVSSRVQKTNDKLENNLGGANGYQKIYNMDNESNEVSLSYIKENSTKYEDRTNEILLSNCSLNSSSSGSSSNSLENKTNNENSEKWEHKQWMNSSQSSLNVTSTPSESTSELSVLSVTNYINPGTMMTKKSTVVNSRTTRTSSSTGAIPKSISFDISADKGDKYSGDDHRSKRGGFFGKLRMGFRNRRGKSFRNSDDLRMENEEEAASGSGCGSGKSQPLQVKFGNNMDSSEQILEKYRTKTFEENNSNKMNEQTQKASRIRRISESTIISNQGCNTFRDVKNKLRMVLSHSTIQLPGDIKVSEMPLQSKIETILRIELGKARKMRRWSSVARITETLKCVQLLNEKSCNKLVKSMKDDILKRSIYTQYLTSSRRELLLSEAFLNGLQEQVCYEKEQCEEYLAILYVDDFLRQKEMEMNNFCEEFKQQSLSDEKCDLLNNFYAELYSSMRSNVLWNEILKERKNTIKKALQRHIISKVYENAFYPNGDGDRDRDRVLFEHIEKLSHIITPGHKYMMIQKKYLRECPWLPAQDALSAMSAFRTPRDKVNCVVHCAKCIMDLLSMAQSISTTADDFTPVLVFVIIKSNPINLLSTIQFVNSFYQNQLCGEEQYWWIQFCAAVEFIKTMDYSD
ncbi:GTPase-activating protein and VPS9 domain-containing protein 1 isoform X2 [Coccinella septempunctata]|uniref:GTPase-activating protein and VPS9 domain-containing protein 1 isoform X2 n=1 Tax=Coccinella septempunctata TaxID=41139 RepID=UPI001D0997EB|nr:GTPase-activating protein and VPS9 domain-containing protein 1 isoform X2 [Coccinella septempunctata]